MTPSPPGFTKPLILQGLFYLGFAHGGTHRGTSSLEVAMKLACRIQQSRHGVYYYRRQFSIAGIRKECRISLQTKNPTIAKEKSLLISAMIVKNKRGGCMQDDEQDILRQIQLLNQQELEESLRNLEITISPPNGGNITIKADPNNPADIQAMLQASREFWESDIGQSMKFNIDQAEPKNDELPAISNQNPSQNLQSNGAEAGIVAGTPLPDFIERFATRKKNTLAP